MPFLSPNQQCQSTEGIITITIIIIFFFGFPPTLLVSPPRPPLTQHLLSTDRPTQLQPLIKRCRQNWKMEMSGQPYVFSCRMTVPSSLHHSLSTPCWRNILPPPQLLLICQLLIHSSEYLLRNPRFVKLFFFISYWLSGRSQHIRDLLMNREARPEFLSALTAFVNLVLSGRCPSDVAPVFFGGRLLALSKKSGVFSQLL